MKGHRAVVSLAAILSVLALGPGLRGQSQQGRLQQGQSQLPPAIVVDHSSIALFDRIPEMYVSAARGMRLMFVDRSVGANIDQYLDCLASPRAPSRCKRQHGVQEFASPASAFDWRGSYPRPNWRQFGWPGSNIPPELVCPGAPAPGAPEWSNRVDCFIRYVDANPTAYDVYTLMISYLEAWDVSGQIGSPKQGFFARSPLKDVDDYEALMARHKDRKFVWTTTNLSRGIGSQQGTAFNDQVREYVRTRGGYLLDIADIESHDPSGRPCYDNRDGVPYIVNGVQQENHADDGQNYPAICQHYTSEKDGGHLGTASAGGVRLAKAWWVLMARIAGWSPE